MNRGPDLNSLPPVPFFKALIGTCKGTAIFRELLGQSLWRALFHLVLLLLMMYAVLMTVDFFRYGEMLREAGTVMDTRFGTLHLSDAGLQPQRFPSDSERHFALTDDIWFDYYPDKAEFASAPTLGNDHRFGILWDARMVWFWVRDLEGKINAFPIIRPPDWDDTKNGAVVTFDTLDEARQYVANLIFLDKPDANVFTLSRSMMPAIRMEALDLSFPQLCDGLLAMLVPMKNAVLSLQFLMLVVMISVFFAFSTWMFAIPPIRQKMGYARYLVQMLYTAYPGILLGTLWIVLGLDALYFDGSQLMVIVLLIYSFPVTFTIQRFLIPPPKPPRHTPIDDDF